MDVSAGRRPVCAGTAWTSHAETVTLIERFQKRNVDYVLVVAPIYCKPPQRAPVDFFSDVAARTEKPLPAYHIPGPVAQLCRLHADGNGEGVQRLNKQLATLFDANGHDTTPIAFKYILKRIGMIPRNEHRLPMTTSTPELEARLDAVLEDAGPIRPGAPTASMEQIASYWDRIAVPFKRDPLQWIVPQLSRWRITPVTVEQSSSTVRTPKTAPLASPAAAHGALRSLRAAVSVGTTTPLVRFVPIVSSTSALT